MNFALDIPENLPAVRGDLERVRQILGNLVSNGYNYTPDGGQVTIRMRAGEGEVIVDICDNGIGIAPDEQKRVFERFYRGEDPLVLATAGTGWVWRSRARWWKCTVAVSGSNPAASAEKGRSSPSACR